MATALYPAIIERAGDTFSVFFPDLPGCTSAGDTVEEAYQNAAVALAGHIEVAHKDGGVPDPSCFDDIEHDPEVDEVARLFVPVELPGRAVRLNITLDEGLVARIDKVARNRSGFLADAARDALARREMADA